MLVLLGCLVAFGQEPETENTDPEMVAPDVIINVQEHRTTADLVTITMRRAGYPPDLLARQIQELGRLLGVEARGTYIDRINLDQSGSITAVKATFTIDGIINRDSQELNLQALVKAFLGVPEPHTVKAFLVTFEGEQPGSKTLKSLRKGTVRVVAHESKAPLGLEYRILSLTQDPAEVVIPTSVEQTPPVKPSERPAKAQNPFVVPLAIGAGVAAIALVYFALLKKPGRK